jgi:N-acetylmuramoyl-L-alanine amidase
MLAVHPAMGDHLPMLDLPSPNREPRPAGAVIDILVLHYTGMRTAEEALARMCDPAARVSAHYCIDETGTITRLVPEVECAWHAGVSYWRGHRNVNARSIGIELANPGHEFGYIPFPEIQLTALILLASAIVRRHGIARRDVVGHSDIAPARKRDPGELFDWKRLAAAGIGLWPQPAAEADPEDVPMMMETYGYRIHEEGAIAAFQRHFRPERIDGVADDETARLLAGLLEIAD